MPRKAREIVVTVERMPTPEEARQMVADAVPQIAALLDSYQRHLREEAAKAAQAPEQDEAA